MNLIKNTIFTTRKLPDWIILLRKHFATWWFVTKYDCTICHVSWQQSHNQIEKASFTRHAPMRMRINLECFKLAAVCHLVYLVQVPSGSRPRSDGELCWQCACTQDSCAWLHTPHSSQGHLQHPTLPAAATLGIERVTGMPATADITGLCEDTATLSSSLLAAACSLHQTLHNLIVTVTFNLMSFDFNWRKI